MMRLIRFLEGCEYPDCDAFACDMAYDREFNKVLVVCEKHAHMVLDKVSPEYDHVCENCGCYLPIN